MHSRTSRQRAFFVALKVVRQTAFIRSGRRSPVKGTRLTSRPSAPKNAPRLNLESVVTRHHTAHCPPGLGNGPADAVTLLIQSFPPPTFSQILPSSSLPLFFSCRVPSFAAGPWASLLRKSSDARSFLGHGPDAKKFSPRKPRCDWDGRHGRVFPTNSLLYLCLPHNSSSFEVSIFLFLLGSASPLFPPSFHTVNREVSKGQRMPTFVTFSRCERLRPLGLIVRESGVLSLFGRESARMNDLKKGCPARCQDLQ